MSKINQARHALLSLGTLTTAASLLTFASVCAVAQSDFPDTAHTLKAIGQQYQAALSALQATHEQQIQALLLPDQAAKFSAGKSVLLTEEQSRKKKALDHQYRLKLKAIEADHKRQIAGLISPEEIAGQEAKVKAEKAARRAQAFSKLPIEEQRVVELLRQYDEQRNALTAEYQKEIRALLTPEQAKAYEETESLQLSDDQTPAHKAIQVRFNQKRQAMEAEKTEQLNALLSVLTPEQAAKYRKSPSKGGLVDPAPPAAKVKKK